MARSLRKSPLSGAACRFQLRVTGPGQSEHPRPGSKCRLGSLPESTPDSAGRRPRMRRDRHDPVQLAKLGSAVTSAGSWRGATVTVNSVTARSPPSSVTLRYKRSSSLSPRAGVSALVDAHIEGANAPWQAVEIGAKVAWQVLAVTSGDRRAVGREMKAVFKAQVKVAVAAEFNESEFGVRSAGKFTCSSKAPTSKARPLRWRQTQGRRPC